MARLTYSNRRRVIAMLQKGLSQRQIARLMRCSHTTVMRLSQKYQRTGSVADLQPGRRETVAERDIDSNHPPPRTNRRPATCTAATNIGAHKRTCSLTVRERQQMLGLQTSHAYTEPAGPIKNPKRSLQWSGPYSQWHERQGSQGSINDSARNHVAIPSNKSQYENMGLGVMAELQLARELSCTYARHCPAFVPFNYNMHPLYIDMAFSLLSRVNEYVGFYVAPAHFQQNK